MKAKDIKKINETNERNIRDWMDKRNTIRGVLIDVVNNAVEVVEIGRSLQAYYNLLGCDTIDIVTRKVGDHLYQIVLDDEGLLKPDPVPSAFDSNDKPCLVGNLFVVGYEVIDGELTSIDDNEIQQLMSHVGMYFMPALDPSPIPCLTGVEYA